MAATSDHYATLEVRPSVDGAALRRAYRDLMRRYHPDVTTCDDAEERCRAINEAYACLRDPETRAHYDANRRARQRSRKSVFMAETMPIQPTVHGSRKDWLGEEDEQSRGRKAMVVGAAILLTIATFAATSAVDRGGPAAEDEMVTFVRMQPAEPAAVSRQPAQPAR